jgi:hypothetical protein
VAISTPYGTAAIARGAMPGLKIQVAGGQCTVEHAPAK